MKLHVTTYPIIGICCGLLLAVSSFVAVSATQPASQCGQFTSLDMASAAVGGGANGEKMADFEAAYAEATRREKLARDLAVSLSEDTRWDDPEQVPYLEEALSSTTGMADDYAEEADEASVAIGCLDAQ